MKLSARNQLKGKVVSINNGAVNSIVSIDIGGGNIITSTISCSAVEELNLQVGSFTHRRNPKSSIKLSKGTVHERNPFKHSPFSFKHMRHKFCTIRP